jgi:hypothetical protein
MVISAWLDCQSLLYVNEINKVKMRQGNWKGYIGTPFQQFRNTQDLVYTRQWLYQLCLDVKCDPIKEYKKYYQMRVIIRIVGFMLLES